MTVDIERLVQEREAAANGWQPATFVLFCPDRRHHDWGSEGLRHDESARARPRIPACPARGCGLLFWLCCESWGPTRPGVVEPSA